MATTSTTTNMPKKGRGRPMSFDRQQLLEKVMHMFWERGFEGLSFNEIASETGLTRASLYNCFGSKEALFEEAMALYTSTSPDTRLEKLEEGQSVAQAFFDFFAEASHQLAQDEKSRGCMTINCLNELVAGKTGMANRLLEQFTAKKQRLHALFQQAIRQGELPSSADAQMLASLMLTFLAGLSTFSKTTSDEVELRQICEGFLEKMGFTRPA